MTRVKHMYSRLRDQLYQLYFRKELAADAAKITVFTLVIYILPMVYTGITDIRWRVAVALMLITLAVRLIWALVQNLIRRNTDLQLGEIRIPRIIVGIFFIVILVIIGANLTAKMGQPSRGIYEMEVSAGRLYAVMATNSVLFAICSQTALSMCTLAEMENVAFAKTFGRTLLYSCAPMTILAFGETLLIERVGTESFGGSALAILLTILLWVTSIAVNEKLKFVPQKEMDE